MRCGGQGGALAVHDGPQSGSRPAPEAGEEGRGGNRRRHTVGAACRPEAATERCQLAQRLREVIRSLPQEQRKILLLRDWYGLNYGEIAEALRLSPGTVSSRLHHARRKVREAMEGWLR